MPARASVSARVPRSTALEWKLPTRLVGRRATFAALGALVLVYGALAALLASPGSTVVLAAYERSPDWLLGPLRPFGLEGADGPLAGPLFYTGLWLALVAYCVVLAGARAIGPRLAAGIVVGLHMLFFLAPPLLSQDVFSYISYARLDVLHDLSPYTHSPDDVPWDEAFVFAGSKDSTSVYGPLFTFASYPLAKLSVPAAFWTLKATAALATLGVVALAAASARRIGRDPVPVALAIGLNPLVLIHVVAGAHNDALMVLLWMGGVLAMVSAAPVARTATGTTRTADEEAKRDGAGGLLATAAAGIKLSAGIVVPFLTLGARRRAAALAGALAAIVAVAVVGLSLFGAEALDALGTISENQERTSRWSLPQRSADALAAIFGGSASDIVDFTRVAFAVAFAFALLALLRRTWNAERGSPYWIEAAGWATLALLLASAWLVPWYAIWLLPLAALSGNLRLLGASLALCAYMLVIAVPL